MIDSTVSISRACATAAWSLALLTFGAAWIVFLASSNDLGLLLGETGILFVGIAMVLTIRGWASKVCSVVRATAPGRRDAPGDDVVSLR